MNLLSAFVLAGGVGDTAQGRNMSATVSIGLKNGNPHFASSGYGGTTRQGGTVSSLVLDSGELDLTNLDAGPINIHIKLNDDIWNAGYRFPGDVFQAVAIAFIPPGSTTPPTPVFGSANWPDEFVAPGITPDGRTISFLDKDDNSEAYEYSIALNKPGGGTVVLDPKIKNGGHQ